MVMQRISEDGFLSDAELHGFIQEACATMPTDNRRVLFIIPDHTRSMPMPLVFRALFDALHGRVKRMDYLIALGTHPPMTEEMINRLVGVTPEERAGKYLDIGIFNHAWQDPASLACIGILSEAEIDRISGGLMKQSVEVTINRRVLELSLIHI